MPARSPAIPRERGELSTNEVCCPTRSVVVRRQGRVERVVALGPSSGRRSPPGARSPARSFGSVGSLRAFAEIRFSVNARTPGGERLPLDYVVARKGTNGEVTCAIRSLDHVGIGIRDHFRLVMALGGIERADGRGECGSGGWVALQRGRDSRYFAGWEQGRAPFAPAPSAGVSCVTGPPSFPRDPARSKRRKEPRR